MGSLAAPGLAQGDSSSPIPFSGVWPSAAVTKSWYYIVHVGAGDDTTAGDNFVPSVGISVVPPDVRYSVPSVVNTGATVAGGILSGQFSITNAGSAPGRSPSPGRRTYRRTTSTRSPTSSSPPIQSAGWLALVPPGPLPFTGTWPTTGGSWHLIVRISAADDTTTGDNETSTLAAIPLTIVAPNYSITAVPFLRDRQPARLSAGLSRSRTQGRGRGLAHRVVRVRIPGKRHLGCGGHSHRRGEHGRLPVPAASRRGTQGTGRRHRAPTGSSCAHPPCQDPTITDAPSRPL